MNVPPTSKLYPCRGLRIQKSSQAIREIGNRSSRLQRFLTNIASPFYLIVTAGRSRAVGLICLRDYGVYLIVRLFICLVQALPLTTCRTLARWLATLTCDVFRVRHEVIDENL